MKSAKIVAVVLAMGVASDAAAPCATGMKAKTTLTDLYCTTKQTNKETCGACCEAETVASTGAVCDTNACGTNYVLKTGASSLNCAAATCATSDQSTCCDLDTTKCAGATVTCPSGKYKDSTKDSTAVGSDAAAACCTTKPECAAAACGAGYILKSDASNYTCSMACASANDQSTCCDMDTSKCGGATVTCASGKFKDSSKALIAIGSDAAAACCTDKAACDANACGANYVLKSGAASLKCAMAACAASDQSTCCDLDTTKCGGATVTCASGSYKDTTKATTAVGSDAAAACCTAQATCDANACGASYKLKTGASSLKCATSACASSDQSTCCDLDTTKCGGTSVTCATGKYLDTTKAGNDAGSDAAAACCTDKATCQAFIDSANSGLTTGAHKAAQPTRIALLLAAVAGVAFAK